MGGAGTITRKKSPHGVRGTKTYMTHLRLPFSFSSPAFFSQGVLKDSKLLSLKEMQACSLVLHASMQYIGRQICLPATLGNSPIRHSKFSRCFLGSRCACPPAWCRYPFSVAHRLYTPLQRAFIRRRKVFLVHRWKSRYPQLAFWRASIVELSTLGPILQEIRIRVT